MNFWILFLIGWWLLCSILGTGIVLYGYLEKKKTVLLLSLVWTILWILIPFVFVWYGLSKLRIRKLRGTKEE